MKTSHYRLCLACIGLVSSMTAHAAVNQWAEHANVEFGFASGSGRFADVFSFHLPTAGDLSASAVSAVLLPAVGPFSGELTLYEGSVAGSHSALGGFSFGPDSGRDAWTLMGLGAGDYFYQVSGEYTGYGSYLLTSSFRSSIPEPHSFALLLAGFGVLLASRRMRHI